MSLETEDDKSVTYTMFLESAGSTEVLRAMDTNVKSKDLVLYGARSLVVLSHNPELRMSLSEGDGISLIVDCLHSHKRETTTCMVLLIVLINLLYQNRDSKKALVDSNGIPIVLSIITANHANSSFLQSAFHVLRHATNDTSVRLSESKGRTHIFREVISALQQHTQNEPLVVHGLWIILNLMNGNHDNKTKFLLDHGLAFLESVSRDQERNDNIMSLVATVMHQMLKVQRIRTEILAKGSKSILFHNLSNFTEQRPLLSTYRALYVFSLHSTARNQIGMALGETILHHMRIAGHQPPLYAIIGKLFLRLCLDPAVKAYFRTIGALDAIRAARVLNRENPASLRFYLAAEVFLSSSDETLPARLDVAEVLLMQHVDNRRSDESSSDSDSDSDSDSESSGSDPKSGSFELDLDGALSRSDDEEDSHSSSDSGGATPPRSGSGKLTAPVPVLGTKEKTLLRDDILGDLEMQLLGTSHLSNSGHLLSSSPHKITGISTIDTPPAPPSSNQSPSNSSSSLDLDLSAAAPAKDTTPPSSPPSTTLMDDPEMEALLKDIDQISSPVQSPLKVNPSNSKHRRRSSRGSGPSQPLDTSLQDLDAELEKLRLDDFGMRTLNKFDSDDVSEALEENLEDLDVSTSSADPDAVLARIDAIARMTESLDMASSSPNPNSSPRITSDAYKEKQALLDISDTAAPSVSPPLSPSSTELTTSVNVTADATEDVEPQTNPSSPPESISAPTETDHILDVVDTTDDKTVPSDELHVDSVEDNEETKEIFETDISPEHTVVDSNEASESIPDTNKDVIVTETTPEAIDSAGVDAISHVDEPTASEVNPASPPSPKATSVAPESKEAKEDEVVKPATPVQNHPPNPVPAVKSESVPEKNHVPPPKNPAPAKSSTKQNAKEKEAPPTKSSLPIVLAAATVLVALVAFAAQYAL